MYLGVMEITMLAVTKRFNGVCIAGVDNNKNWIRPVKSQELVLKDIQLKDGGYILSSNIYEFSFIRQAPHNYQTENYLIDNTKVISHVRKLTEEERKKLFSELAENSLVTSNPDKNISDILKEKKRSLILLGPVNISLVSLKRENGMDTPRIVFKIDSVPVRRPFGKVDLPCTDLKFRAFAKQLLDQRGTNELRLVGQELKELLRFNEVYIEIGLIGEEWKGAYWPMIIGVHTIPDYNQEIDYNDI